MKIISKKQIHNGYLKIDELTLEASNGDMIQRDVLTKKTDTLSDDAVTILLVDTKTDEFVMVSQFRQGAEKTLIEAVAGTLENGENPEQCAIREAEEETGYSVNNIRYCGSAYSSPGCMRENTHFYIADIDSKVSEGGGLPEEHEEIDIVRLAIKGIKLSDFSDLKTQRIIAEYIFSKH